MTVDSARSPDPVIRVVRVDAEPASIDALGRWRRRAVAACAAAFLASVTLGWQLSLSAPPSALTGASATRDEVVIAASDAVEVLNTLDHRAVEAGLGDWESVATGALADQVTSIDRRQRSALADAGTVSTARVVDAAVVELDVDAGTATVIALTEVTVTPESGEPAARRHRYTADLRLVDGRWLVEALTTSEVDR